MDQCVSFLHVGRTAGGSHGLRLGDIHAGAAAKPSSCVLVEQVAACRESKHTVGC